jgi:hypothetical protein
VLEALVTVREVRNVALCGQQSGSPCFGFLSKRNRKRYPRVIE